jgi:iron(III) transport system permease protein
VRWLVRGAGMAIVITTMAVVIVPIGVAILMGFWSTQLGTGGQFTFEKYAMLLTEPRMVPYLWNTLEFTAGASLIAMVLATLFAWAVTSINLPARAILRLLPIVPLLLPGLLKDPAAVQLYSPTTGLVNLAIMHVFGTTHPVFDVFTMLGMTTIAGLYVMPVPYLILLAPFSALDRTLEEASRASGAGMLRTFRKVLVPSILPALLSALTLTMILVASSFETPVIIGLPAGILTYMSVIYRALQGAAFTDFNLAAAESSLYMALTCTLLIWYLVATNRERRFVTVSGRGYQSTLRSSPAWMRYLLASIIVLYTIVVGVIPFVLNALISLTPYYTVTAGNPFAKLTLQNYQFVFSDNVVGAIANSLKLATAVSLASLALAGLFALIALKSRIRGRRLVEALGTIPIGIPAMVFSVSILMTFLTVPGLGAVYGTFVPLLVAEVVVFLPFGLRVLGSALIQLDDELLEVSRVCGATRLRSTVSIVVPLLLPAIANAFAFIFVLSYRELGAAVLLVTPSTDLVPTVTFNYWTTGTPSLVAALNMVTMFVPIVPILIVFAITDPARRRRRRSRVGRIDQGVPEAAGALPA